MTPFHWLAAVLIAAPSFAADAGEQGGVLRPGSYEIVVNLDLPHLEGMGASKTVQVCITDGGVSTTHGLAVLSENNPLGRCPASNVVTEGGALTFEVHCEGKNAAEGYARYTLRGDAFEGRIDMKMGGKNMTMSETQKGKRVGDCPSTPRS